MAMAQEAYDFALFETRERAPEKVRTEQAAELRSVAGGKKTRTAFQKLSEHAVIVVLGISFFVAAFFLIKSEAQLTEYTQQIQVQNAALAVAKSEYSYLEATLNASINLEQVEKVAKELGLVKVDESQVTYIRIEDEAILEVSASKLEQFTENAQLLVSQLLEYLDP